MDKLIQKIFNLQSEQEFNDLSLEIFRYQFLNNPIYNRYVQGIGVDYRSIGHFSNIPFLPIEFFKTSRVVTGKSSVYRKVFTSSGTTGQETSKHYIIDEGVYERSFLEGFRLFYGPPQEYILLALLPSYLERSDSSLVYMADRLIRETKHPASGFYLRHNDQLISALENPDRKVILLGVTFALLDLAESKPPANPGLIIIETGGMKGRRREMVREEVHQVLGDAFKVPSIHSEYGMTELLSQAYSQGNGIFRTPPWMKVLARDANDPLTLVEHGRTGGINVIDLANIHSCSFIATQDLGKTYPDGTFEVLGRFDTSDIRGCNLMVG